MQIDVNNVIDNLLNDIKELHRDKALLKAQVETLQNQLLEEVRKDVKDETQ